MRRGMATHSKGVFRLGLVAMIASSVVQLGASHYPAVHPDLADGLRGLCLGVFIGAMAVTAWRNCRMKPEA